MKTLNNINPVAFLVVFTLTVLVGLAGGFCNPLVAQEAQAEKPAAKGSQQGDNNQRSEIKRADYVSDASFWVANFSPKLNANSPSDMAQAAEAFLASLTSEQSKKVSHSPTSPERQIWTNVPADPKAGGLRLAEMNETQINAACQMFACLLSEQGYQKVVQIMLADDQLLRGGRRRRGFGTENFAVVLFGEPDVVKPWGVQLDGHHVALNISVEGKKNTISPSFIGTQPHVFQIASQKFRPLEKETDIAYQLLNSLTDEQTKATIVEPKRGRIQTGPGMDGKVPEVEGMKCSSLDGKQREMLVQLLRQWIDDMPSEHAALRMKELESEIDQMRFSWHGQTKAKSDISYRIQGPTVIIEYACQTLGGNPIDHLHTMYRNPTNEYGGQLKSDSKK